MALLDDNFVTNASGCQNLNLAFEKDSSERHTVEAGRERDGYCDCYGDTIGIYMVIGLKVLVEGSLEVTLPTIWRDEKAVSREKSQKRKDQKKEDAGARKGRKVAKHCVFSWSCGSGRLKSRLAKAAGAKTSGEMRDENLHAVVARSTFWSQNVLNTPCSDHFWKLRCRKSARRCGAKHILKSKCTKHTMLGPLLEVAMSKKCTPLWREAHFEVKMY